MLWLESHVYICLDNTDIEDASPAICIPLSISVSNHMRQIANPCPVDGMHLMLRTDDTPYIPNTHSKIPAFHQRYAKQQTAFPTFITSISPHQASHQQPVAAAAASSP